MNTRNWLLIHHSASYATKEHHQFDAIRRYHIEENGWDDIGYHYVAERDGTMKEGRKAWQRGIHCWQWGMNYRSLGICLAGNFEKQEPSEEQWESLERLLTILQLKHGIRDGKIKTHKQFSNTFCPGKNLRQEHLDRIIFPRRMRNRIERQPLPDVVELSR